MVLGSSDPLSILRGTTKGMTACKEVPEFPDSQVRNVRLGEMSRVQKLAKRCQSGGGSCGTGRTGQLGLKLGSRAVC